MAHTHVEIDGLTVAELLHDLGEQDAEATRIHLLLDFLQAWVRLDDLADGEGAFDEDKLK